MSLLVINNFAGVDDCLSSPTLVYLRRCLRHYEYMYPGGVEKQSINQIYAHKTTVMDIAEDLRTEIAMRLDRESIGRLRCVSKRWNSLLSSSLFVTKWKDPIEGNKTSCVLTSPGGVEICWFSEGPDARQVRIVPGWPEEIPLKTRYGVCDCLCYALVGVIRGVLCLASPHRFKVWNPVIQRVLVFDRKYIKKYEDGFGLDPATNELMVVVFSPGVQFYEVLSVLDRRWRWGTIPTGIRREVLSNSCYWNGAIYWMAEKSSLLVFECGREEWRTEEMGLEGVEKKQLFVYNEMLTVVRRVEGKCELWGMKGSGEWSLVLGGVAVHKEESDVFYMSRGTGQQPIGSLEYQPSLLLMDAKLDQLNKKHTVTPWKPVRCIKCFPELPPITSIIACYTQCKIPL